MQETEILRWRFELLVKEDSKSSPFHSTFLPYLDLKKQTWDFDPLHISDILTSSKYEKETEVKYMKFFLRYFSSPLT